MLSIYRLLYIDDCIYTVYYIIYVLLLRTCVVPVYIPLSLLTSFIINEVEFYVFCGQGELRKKN